MTRILTIILLAIISVAQASRLCAQNGSSFYEGERVHAVLFNYTNLPADSVAARNLKSEIRGTFKIYPHTVNRTLLLDSYIERVKQLPEVASASYEIQPAATGGIDVLVDVTLSSTPKAKGQKSGAFVRGQGKDFPVLYLDRQSLLTLKIAAAEMLYMNDNAWYAQPDKMLQGNPLVDNPAGKGATGWVEGWTSAGIYGITALSTRYNIYVYGGVSYIISGSAGRELFTDRSRVYGGVEDAFVGISGGFGNWNGGRLLYNLSYGRQQFSIGQGFIIRNTASNGDNRGALQLNPRWAADYLFLGSLSYNRFLVQLFQLSPDELPIIDSRTVIRGINTEWGDGNAYQLGFSFLQIPHSNFKYYTPQGDQYSREGLQVYNIRYYGNRPPGVAGLFYKTEFAYERNSNFPMAAFAGYGEAGWSFAQTRLRPTVSYRFAYFSGDNPNTKRYERWDPLLSGGNAEEWVLGANHFKVVQNSNLMAHRIQLSLRPSRKIELVPQLFYFQAVSKNNIGGNPALSELAHKPYGYEVNMTGKYFYSRNWYFHGHVAYTIPGSGVQSALNHDAKPWLSVMAFARFSF